MYNTGIINTIDTEKYSSKQYLVQLILNLNPTNILLDTHSKYNTRKYLFDEIKAFNSKISSHANASDKTFVNNEFEMKPTFI